MLLLAVARRACRWPVDAAAAPAAGCYRKLSHRWNGGGDGGGGGGALAQGSWAARAAKGLATDLAATTANRAAAARGKAPVGPAEATVAAAAAGAAEAGAAW